MLFNLRKFWYYSSCRFYMKNFIWNYSFWLKSKKIFEEIEYQVKDHNGFYTGEKRKIKKFKGFLLNDKIYLDNPGFPIQDRDLWIVWKNKGLIK